MKISVCIPTYNRASHLANCLQSIIVAKSRTTADFEVCVSDNGSTDETEAIVRRAQERLEIKHRKNPSNLGRVRNYLQAVEMASGEFVWLIGDDDLLLPDAINELHRLTGERPGVDFFYVNSSHLTTEYVDSFPRPFDTANLPKTMPSFSSWSRDGEMPFLDLIDPRISFDFLAGMYLAVFRRRNWIKNTGALNAAALDDPREFSSFDNTIPHMKIFAGAFARSRAYFHSRPLIVSLTGAREWTPMFQLVMSVRLVEGLEEYRRNGLPLWRYLWCKNYALNNFIPDLGSMFVRRDVSGYAYVNPVKLILGACLYPNFYLSFVNFVIRKTKLIVFKALRTANGREPDTMPR